MFVVRWNPGSATDIAFTVASSRRHVLKQGFGTSVVTDAPCLLSSHGVRWTGQDLGRAVDRKTLGT